MMFIAMLFAGVLIFFLAVCAVGFLTSVGLLAVFCVKSKKNGGRKVGKTVCLIAACVFGIPLLIALIFVCISLHELTIIPEDYIDREKITYTDDGFVSESREKFVRLDYGSTAYLLYKDPYKESAAPAYSYAPEGRYRRSSWYNIYRRETGAGYPVYFCWSENNSEFIFYAKSEEAETIRSYYGDSCNYVWGISDWSEWYDASRTLPAELTDILEKYTGREDYEAIEYSYDRIFYAISSDEILYVYRYYLIEKDGVTWLGVKEDFNFERGHYFYYGFALTDGEAEYMKSYFSVETV